MNLISKKMELKIKTCLLFTFGVFLLNSAMANDNAAFSLDLLNETLKATADKSENIIISPFSIQTCLALAFIGADGKTAEELSTGLRLGSLDKSTVASNFHQLLSRTSSLIEIANKIYTQNGVEVKPEFNKIATEKFNSTAENVDFEKQEETAKIINDWVRQQTNYKIQNLIEPKALKDARLLLMNAIYFKGYWKNPFEKKVTQKTKFWNDESSSVDVDMMYVNNDFKYGELQNLDAKVIRLPYENSNLYMLVVVPNKKTGLKDLEKNLNGIEFSKIEKDMYTAEVSLQMPKFKTEYSVKLNNILKDMGMRNMFSNNSDFQHLTAYPVRVDEVYHKAVIEVDEVSTEAAGTTYIEFDDRSDIINFNKKYLTVDRPFLYFIKDESAVYFMGRISKF